MGPTATDAELLAAVPDDVAAFEAFYRRHVRTVTAFAATRCSSAHDVADVVAQTFIRLVAAIDSNDSATPLPDDPNRRDPSEPARDVSSTGDPDEIVGIDYVDPDTYRPVRRIGYPGTSAEYVMTYEYLPRTPENLAQIAVPVPEGFTQVAALRGDGDRADAGCG